MLVLVVGLVVAAVLLALPPPLTIAVPAEAVRTAGPDLSPLHRLRPVLALVGAAGGRAMVGGSFGYLAALVAGVTVWVVLGRGEPPSVVRRRERLVEDLPTGVDLLGSCLDAGAAPETALHTVSRAIGGPVGEELAALHHRLEIGVDPRTLWREVSAHPQLGPLGRAVGRAHETGAPIGAAVHRLSTELRERARADVEERARSIEVKASAPLGLCLLPAFVLLGVVPMVVGVFSSLRFFG